MLSHAALLAINHGGIHLQEGIQGLLRDIAGSDAFKPRESAVCTDRPSTMNVGGVCNHLNQGGFAGFIRERA